MDTNIPRMSCQEAVELLPWLINGTLDDAERQEVREHLSACGSCRGELDDTVQAWEVLSEHIPSLALAEYAMGERPSSLDREQIERHLALCPSCRGDLEPAMAESVLDFESAARRHRSRRREGSRRRAAMSGGEYGGFRRGLLAIAASIALAVAAAMIWSVVGEGLMSPNDAIESGASLDGEGSRQELSLNAWQEQPLWNGPAIFVDGFESGGMFSWPEDPAGMEKSKWTDPPTMDR